MATRTSTLAEIKVFSLASYLTGQGKQKQNINLADVSSVLADMRSRLSDGSAATIQSLRDLEIGGVPLFRTVGIARSIRIDESFGTQRLYAIGSPTRPRLVPNNAGVDVSAERLQLDARDMSHFVTSPQYWYSDNVQRRVGIDDFLLYTFFFVKSKEDPSKRYDIYALMPASSSSSVTSNDVMIINNVTLTGFKYSYEEAFFDLENLVNESITRTATSYESGGGSGTPEQINAG